MMHFFNSKLAGKMGVREAIFVQNIYYLLKKRILENGFNKNSTWVKLSYARIVEYQEYLTRSHIRTVVNHLIEYDFIKIEKKYLHLRSNVLSYSLTDKGWAYMLYSDSEKDRNAIREMVEASPDKELGVRWVYIAEGLKNIDNPYDRFSSDWTKLSDIYGFVKDNKKDSF